VADPTTATAPPAAADDNGEAIRAAVLDYFEGWFDGDPERMRRALHPALSKRSYGEDRARTPALSSLTADQMVAWTALGEGRTDDPDDRATTIEVVDVSRTIASATVRSGEFVEYVHLVQTAGGWRIVNTLWRHADGRHPAD
jgi:hypothetical protein